MKRTHIVAKCGITALAVAGGWVALGFGPIGAAPRQTLKTEEPPAEDKKPESLADFMRVKLEASSKILEGLAVDDPEMIQDGAKKLQELSAAERWRVHNDEMYQQFSVEFRKNAAELVEAAKAKNIDRAALKWMDATMTCIDCHRYVRANFKVAAAD